MGAHDGNDRSALRSLVEAYAFAADRRDADGFAALFSTEATLTVHDPAGVAGRSYDGRTALAAIPQRLGRYDRTMHLVHNHEVEVDGDEATGRVYCTAHHLTGSGPAAADRVLAICYVDRYAREPGGWVFRSREVRVQWSEDRTVQR